VTGRFLHRVRRDKAGVATLEFALLGPALIIMLMGVLQIGIGLQNYNALRNVSADVSRHAMIQYATGNKLSNEQLKDYTTSVAQSAPYLLNSLMTVTVTDAATPQIAGIKEKTLRIEYRIPSILSSMGLNGPIISYTRPMFLVT